MSETHNDKACKSCGASHEWGLAPICSRCVWEHVLETINGIVALLGFVGVMLFPFSLYSVGFWLVIGTWPEPMSLKSFLSLSNFSFLADPKSVSGFAQLWSWLVTQSFASLSIYLILAWIIGARALTLLLELEMTKGALPWFIPRNPFTGLPVTSQGELGPNQKYPPKGFEITVNVSVQFANRYAENVGSKDRPLYKITGQPHKVQLYKTFEHFPYVPPQGSVIATFSNPLLHHWPMVVTSSVLEVASVKRPLEQIQATIYIEPTEQRGKKYSADQDIAYLDNLLNHFVDNEGYYIDDPSVVLEVLHGLAVANLDEGHRRKLEKIAERPELKSFPNRLKIEDKT